VEAPEIWRSHDLIAVSVDVENYYVMLQTACDIMADVVATLGAKKAQAPSESFHKLNEWAQKNRGRLDPAYHLVAAPLSWFGEINSTRTDVVHRGKTMLVYTDRVTFNWGRLIPKLRDLTQAMLDFSESLGRIVVSENDRKGNPKRKIIDGVYVPALGHLLSQYAVPKKSETLKTAARCLIACGGYVEAAYIGYPKGFWWKVLISSSKKLASDIVTAIVPVNASGTVHDCKFVLSDGNKTHGLVACDNGTADAAWLKGATESVKQLQLKYGTQRAVFVVRCMKGVAPQFLPGTQVPLVVGVKPTTITKKVVTALSG